MKKALIYGSCVSRDAVDNYLNRIKLVDYFARSSFSSAFTTPVNINELISLGESNFHKKQIENDTCKTLSKYDSTDLDIILIDLIDERFPVYEYNKNSLVTASSKKIAEHLEYIGCRKIPPYSNEYFEKFEKGFSDFSKLFDKNIFLIKAFWSSEFIDNSKNETVDEKYLSAENNKLEKLYKIIETTSNEKISLITPPSSTLKIDRQHKWGEAPYHYCKQFYTYVMESMFSELNIEC